MKKERSSFNNELKENQSAKSFTAAIEQMAQLLRSQVKLKERVTLTSSTSINNTVHQVAKLLRSAIPMAKAPKKRAWKFLGSKRRKIKK
jgi:hypothetical protein